MQRGVRSLLDLHAGMMMEQSQTLLSSAAEGEAPPEEAEAVWDITRQSAR